MSHYERFWIAEQILVAMWTCYLVLQGIGVRRMLKRLEKAQDKHAETEAMTAEMLQHLHARYPDDEALTKLERMYREHTRAKH